MRKRKISLFLAVCLMLTVFVGCAGKAKTAGSEQDNPDVSKIQSWVGKYSFEESYPPAITMKYAVEIKDDGTAKVDVDGYYCCYHATAVVSGDESNIDIIFDSYVDGEDGHERTDELYAQGNKLFSLSKKDDGIYTDWDSLMPLSLIEFDNQICFKKD